MIFFAEGLGKLGRKVVLYMNYDYVSASNKEKGEGQLEEELQCFALQQKRKLETLSFCPILKTGKPRLLQLPQLEK